MTLREPFKIGSRLLPCLAVGGAELSLEFVGCAENRMVYRWYVDLPGVGEFSEADLKSGVQGCTTQAMFGAFLAFLDAAAESYRHWDGREPIPENVGLFPRPVVEWAATCADELGMLRLEIEESETALIED